MAVGNPHRFFDPQKHLLTKSAATIYLSPKSDYMKIRTTKSFNSYLCHCGFWAFIFSLCIGWSCSIWWPVVIAGIILILATTLIFKMEYFTYRLPKQDQETYFRWAWWGTTILWIVAVSVLCWLHPHSWGWYLAYLVAIPIVVFLVELFIVVPATEEEYRTYSMYG